MRLTPEQISAVRHDYPRTFEDWSDNADFQKLATYLQYEVKPLTSDLIEKMCAADATAVHAQVGEQTWEQKSEYQKKIWRVGMSAAANICLAAVEKTIADYCYFKGEEPSTVAANIMETVRRRLFKPLEPAERVTYMKVPGSEIAYDIFVDGKPKDRVFYKDAAELAVDGYRYRLEKEEASK